MSDRIEPTTHIDIRVVRNLLQSRVNEGKDLLKTANLPNQWKKGEYKLIERCEKAISLLDEAINIKEGKVNATPSSEKSPENTNSNKGPNGKASVQNEENTPGNSAGSNYRP